MKTLKEIAPIAGGLLFFCGPFFISAYGYRDRWSFSLCLILTAALFYTGGLQNGRKQGRADLLRDQEEARKQSKW